MLLAIETSCDETAIALLDLGRVLSGEPISKELLLANAVSSQMDVHQAYGGVVPELAAREHGRNLPLVLDEVFTQAGVAKEDLRAVCVTAGPGLKVCLLVGLSFAKGLALGQRVPLLGLNHLEGHLFAAELLDPEIEIEYPAMALLVSGGHTLLVLLKSFRKYQVLAATRDDAAGEAFDKTATLLGLPYPGGPSLSACAKGGDSSRFPFPIALADDPESFSFSGLKTAAMREIHRLGEQLQDEQIKRDISASLQSAIVKALVDKTKLAVGHYKPRTLILSGGVAANRSLRETLRREIGSEVRVLIPDAQWCTDNAAMMAALGASIIREDPNRFGLGASQDVSVCLQSLNIEARSRWAIDEISPG